MTTVDIVFPVYNEERALPEAIPRLRAFLLETAFPYSWRFVIADNASVDDTPAESRRLAREYGDVEYVRIEEKGRSQAEAAHSAVYSPSRYREPLTAASRAGIR